MCVCVFMCMTVGTRVSFCVEVKDSLRHKSSPSALFEIGLGLLIVAYAKLAGQGTPGDFSSLSPLLP